MSKLIACFDIPMPQYLYAKGEEKEFIYQTRIDDFDIEARLPPEEHGPKSGHITETEFTYCISRILVNVSRELTEEIPPVVINGAIQDYVLRGTFFSKTSRQFEEVAEVVLKRIIRYFKYRLHQPLLSEAPKSRQCFLSPTWLDENRNEIKSGWYMAAGTIPPGIDSYDFGITRLTAEFEPELGKAIENEIMSELYEEILSDAQSAIFQKNYRRAILEMAMACELAIKRIYFSKSSAAGLALEFMEDSQRMSPRVKITDYLTKIAEYALGEKFEDVSSKADMANIDNLFHGRNKVIHSGELIFKSENEKEFHEINRAVLKDWWRSVEKLLAWLNSKRTV